MDKLGSLVSPISAGGWLVTARFCLVTFLANLVAKLLQIYCFHCFTNLEVKFSLFLLQFFTIYFDAVYLWHHTIMVK